jgi:hypothetical protein
MLVDDGIRRGTIEAINDASLLLLLNAVLLAAFTAGPVLFRDPLRRASRGRHPPGAVRPRADAGPRVLLPRAIRRGDEPADHRPRRRGDGGERLGLGGGAQHPDPDRALGVLLYVSVTLTGSSCCCWRW